MSKNPDSPPDFNSGDLKRSVEDAHQRNAKEIQHLPDEFFVEPPSPLVEPNPPAPEGAEVPPYQFKPLAVQESWRSSDVRQLVEAALKNNDFDSLYVIADALEEAGCTDERILNHLRSGCAHTSTCWALALARGIPLPQPKDPQPSPESVELQEQLKAIEAWSLLYHQHFNGLELDISTVEIPERTENLKNIIIIPKGLTLKMTLEALVNLGKQAKPPFEVDYSNVRDLDIRPITQPRDSMKASYALVHRGDREADPLQLQSGETAPSADDLEKVKRVGNIDRRGLNITELFSFTMKYYLDHEKESDENLRHLDNQSWTLTSSRIEPLKGADEGMGDDGGVLNVGWDPGHRRVSVDWHRPGGRRGRLRSRPVGS
jgi:hypothetical protein